MAAVPAAAAKPKAPAPAAAASGISKPPVIRSVTLHKRKYLYLKDIAAFYNYTYRRDTRARTVTLITPARETIVFTETKPLFKLRNVQAYLSYPVVKYKSDLMIEKTDFMEFLDPILRPGRIPKRRIQKIVIDPGHGGKDDGAKGNGITEKLMNLVIARRIGAILVKRGYTVVYTRTADTFVELPARSEFAGKQKCDLFLSVHCNSMADSAVSGIEVFVANPAGVPSFGSTTIGKDSPSTKFNAVNAFWAYLTQSALVKASGAADRGIKRKQFAVIRETPAPSMLVEFGFVSNAAEAGKLKEAAYLDKLAVAVCDAVTTLSAQIKPPQKKTVAAPQRAAQPQKRK